jgi:hypothetical protein
MTWSGQPNKPMQQTGLRPAAGRHGVLRRERHDDGTLPVDRSIRSTLHMARHEITLLAILRGGSDANIRFDDLRGLLLHLGFEERSRGSHHIFFKAGIEELINLQRSGSKAKPYQVRQVRGVISRHGLGDHE